MPQAPMQLVVPSAVSAAVEAKRMLDDIMAFYCKYMYNP